MTVRNLVFIIFFSLAACHARRDVSFNKPLVHADKQSYKVSESIPHHIKVQNANDVPLKSTGNYDSTKTNVINKPIAKDVQYDKKVLANIFYNYFNKARLMKLADEDLDLQINYITDQQGNILRLSFIFADTTSLKPIEIEQLEEILKKDVKFQLNYSIFKYYEFVNLHTFINFKRLVNHAADSVSP